MTSVPATPSTRAARARLPWLPLTLLLCAALALAGGFTHRHGLNLAAASLLLLAWLPTVWRRRSALSLGLWLGLAALLLVPTAMGHAQLALMALPVVFLAAVSWTFAHTLRRGAEPLVQRFIRVIEGEDRLELPGVRVYARGVTIYWAALLAGLSLLSLLVALLAQPGGWLATLGVATPVAVPGEWLAWYPEAGCWALLAAGFLAEYAYRRWHLRALPHPSLHQSVLQLASRWPELMREDAAR